MDSIGSPYYRHILPRVPRDPVAYRASAEGERDIVLVPAWFSNCEAFPELPLLQGWLDAMTSLGRMIFFDQPGTGVSDPVAPGAACSCSM